ncbi:MAG: hypothetical protein ACLFTT_12160 [Candidatus Hydrogenedentota bacterium]
MALCAVAGLAGILAGCATPATESAALEEHTGPRFGRVSFTQERTTLGETVRAIGQEVGGGMAVLHGLEETPVGSISVHRNAYDFLVRRIAEETRLTVQETPHYYFFYRPDYEFIAEMSLEDAIDPALADITTSASFGSETLLFNVLGVLSQNLEVTLVADNVVSETKCGEFFVDRAPLWAALEALLKSSRVNPDAVVIESTPDYVFLRSAQNSARGSMLLNEQELSQEDHALLEKRISAFLPERPANTDQAVAFHAAMRVRSTVGPLSEQIGAPVTADPGLHDLPVNFAVFHDVPVRTLLDLMVRQWPLAVFGYEVRDGAIHFRRR